jgi:hypothetical protein
LMNKDFNVTHSQTVSGFGDNNTLFFNYSTVNFSSILFDVNVASDVNVVSQSFSLCGGCGTPVRLKIRVLNSLGVLKVNFDNNINPALLSTLALTTGSLGTAADLNFNFTTTSFSWKTYSKQVTIDSNVTFNEGTLYSKVDDNAVVLLGLGGFK